MMRTSKSIIYRWAIRFFSDTDIHWIILSILGCIAEVFVRNKDAEVLLELLSVAIRRKSATPEGHPYGYPLL